MLVFSVNCVAWNAGQDPQQGICAKGLAGGHPLVRWCASQCPRGERLPVDTRDPRTLIIDLQRNHKMTAADWALRGPLLWAELHNWALHADLSTASQWLETFHLKIGCTQC